MKSFLCVVAISVSIILSGCSGENFEENTADGGGGGISGTGLGVILVFAGVLANTSSDGGSEPTPRTEFDLNSFADVASSGTESQEYGFYPSDRCGNVQPSIPDNFRGMWTNEENKLLVVENRQIFYSDLQGAEPLNPISLTDFGSILDESPSESEYFYTFSREELCTPVQSVSLVEDGEDGTILNVLGNDAPITISFTRAAASDFIRPPEWLVGTWHHTLENGTTSISRQFTSTNIIINSDEGISDYSYWLSEPTSIFTASSSESNYRYSFSVGAQNNLAIVESYRLLETGNVEYHLKLSSFGGETIYTYELEKR